MFRDELPGLQMNVACNNFGLERFECEVIKKNKSLVEEVKAL